jgi:hypothetical protein
VDLGRASVAQIRNRAPAIAYVIMRNAKKDACVCATESEQKSTRHIESRSIAQNEIRCFNEKESLVAVVDKVRALSG